MANANKRLAAVDENTALLLRDLKKNASGMDRLAATNIMRTYYQLQRVRIVQGNRASALEKFGKSAQHLTTLNLMFENLETEVKLWLDVYSNNHPVGQWALNQYGIGPVLSGALLAAIDIEKAPYASCVHSYFGLDPSKVRKKGEKSPYDPQLKAIAWKIGESFVKVCNNPQAFYGQRYLMRKSYEWSENLRGNYAHLVGQRNYTYSETTEAYKWTNGEYCGVDADGKGVSDPKDERPGIRWTADRKPVAMIPPVAIHERSKRWTVKLFLSHFWQKLYEHHYQKPAPLPYAITYHGKSHDTFIAPPA